MYGTSILSRFDDKVIGFARRARIPALRLGLAVVYLWFGAIKLIPGGSPIEALAVRTVSALTFGIITGDAARLTAGVSEVVHTKSPSFGSSTTTSGPSGGSVG